VGLRGDRAAPVRTVSTVRTVGGLRATQARLEFVVQTLQSYLKIYHICPSQRRRVYIAKVLAETCGDMTRGHPTMVITPDIELQILHHYRVEGWREATIAKHLHVHQIVVQRVLAQAGVPKASPPQRPTKIEMYLPFMRQNTGGLSRTCCKSTLSTGSQAWLLWWSCAFSAPSGLPATAIRRI
jgi:hypothetical protein